MDASFNLFGDDFAITVKKPDVKKLVDKVKNPTKKEKDTTEKALKSKKLSMSDRVVLVCERILKVLGHQKKNVVVIRDR
jgi:hypothetical protein